MPKALFYATAAGLTTVAILWGLFIVAIVSTQASTPRTPGVTIMLPDGRTVVAELDGLTLDTSVTPAVLRVTAPWTVPWKWRDEMLTSTDGTHWTMTAVPVQDAVRVYWNGLRLSQGDYTRAGQVVTLTRADGRVGDKVTAEYWSR